MLRFREQPTPFEKFLQMYQVQNDIQNSILSSHLYKMYTKMCATDDVKAISQISFTKQLEKKGFKKSEKRTSQGFTWDVSLSA